LILVSHSNFFLVVCADVDTLKYKGKTVMTEEERIESVRHCRWVDEVIPGAPWIINQEFLDLHHIDLVAHDDIPYASADSDDVYAFVKKQGKFLATDRTEGISTSDIITRIIRGYEVYARRNLKKGYNAKDLNLGFVAEHTFRLENKLEDVKTRLEKEAKDFKLLLRGKDVRGPGVVADTTKGFLALFGSRTTRPLSPSIDGNSSGHESPDESTSNPSTPPGS